MGRGPGAELVWLHTEPSLLVRAVPLILCGGITVKPIATRVVLVGYKGPEWERELPGGGEEKANLFDRLLWELEIACSGLRRATKQFRAEPSEGERKNLWECRKAYWLAHYRMMNFWDRNPEL